MARGPPVRPGLHALALRGLGNCAATAGDRGRALELYERSLETFRGLGDEAGAAVRMTRVAFDSEDRDRARALAAEALECFRRLGIVKGEAQLLTLFGGFEREDGNLDAAVEYFEQSIEPLRRTMDDRRGTLEALARFARAAAELGDEKLAGRMWAAAEAEYERDPVPEWEEERESFGAPVHVRDGPDGEPLPLAGGREALAAVD